LNVALLLSGLANNTSSLKLIGLIILIVIGLVVAILIIHLFLILIPAAIVALVVWFFTGSLWWAGIAFLAIAVLSIIKKI